MVFWPKMTEMIKCGRTNGTHGTHARNPFPPTIKAPVGRNHFLKNKNHSNARLDYGKNNEMSININSETAQMRGN